MAIMMDKALGIHQHALEMRVERSRVLAGNIANVETPGYLARDYDFRTALSRVAKELETHRTGQPLPGLSLGSELRYRVPMQPSADGNTAELSVEQARFAENAMDFQTSLTFLNLKISGLRKAIEGQ